MVADASRQVGSPGRIGGGSGDAAVWAAASDDRRRLGGRDGTDMRRLRAPATRHRSRRATVSLGEPHGYCHDAHPGDADLHDRRAYGNADGHPHGRTARDELGRPSDGRADGAGNLDPLALPEPDPAGRTVGPRPAPGRRQGLWDWRALPGRAEHPSGSRGAVGRHERPVPDNRDDQIVVHDPRVDTSSVGYSGIPAGNVNFTLIGTMRDSPVPSTTPVSAPLAADGTATATVTVPESLQDATPVLHIDYNGGPGLDGSDFQGRDYWVKLSLAS